jgi:hypothetical protein
MARKRAHDANGTFTADNPSTPAVDEAWVEVKEEAPKEPEAAETKQSEPVNIETVTPSSEPVQAPPAPLKEAIETDVRKKLSNRSLEEDVFVPSSPAVLEHAAKEVAKQGGFDLTRGTSIGARLIARSRKMV